MKKLRGFIQLGTLGKKLTLLLEDRIQARSNLLISGGKTPLLNVLTDLIPKEEQVFLIENTFKIRIRGSNLVRFETHRAE